MGSLNERGSHFGRVKMDLSVATFFEKNMVSTRRIILLFHRAMWHNPLE